MNCGFIALILGIDVEWNTKERREQVPYSFTEHNIEALWNRPSGFCALTGRPLSKIGESAHLDHIIPLARRGTNDSAICDGLEVLSST
jgi:hypothetical protein